MIEKKEKIVRMPEFGRNNLIKICIIYLIVNVREGMKYYKL